VILDDSRASTSEYKGRTGVPAALNTLLNLRIYRKMARLTTLLCALLAATFAASAPVPNATMPVDNSAVVPVALTPAPTTPQPTATEEPDNESRIDAMWLRVDED
jgi:hypothetical protein